MNLDGLLINCVWYIYPMQILKKYPMQSHADDIM